MAKRYESMLQEIEGHLARGEFESAVGDSGRAFEKALKELISELYQSLKDIKERDELADAERKHGKGSKTYHDLGFGGLVGLYREAKLEAKLRRIKESNFRLSRTIPWDLMVELRNAAQHEGEYDGSLMNERHAQMMYHNLKNFLFESELAGNGPTVSKSLESEKKTIKRTCAACSADLQSEWSFCPICGTQMSSKCYACERPIKPEWKRCPYCETPVRGFDAKQDKAAREYKLMCIGAYGDDIVNSKERLLLNEKRLELGLSEEDAEAIEQECVSKEVIEYQRYLQGVYIDGSVNDQERKFLEGVRESLGIAADLAATIEREYKDSISPSEG